MKMNNMTIKVYEAFNHYDQDRRGLISVDDFYSALDTILVIKKLKRLDIQFLSFKYIEQNIIGINNEAKIIPYQKFLKDFEQIEKKGLLANLASDPLAKSQLQTNPAQSFQMTGVIPDEVKQTYDGLA